MPKKAHTEEQIVAVLRQAEAGEKVRDILPEGGDQRQIDFWWLANLFLFL